MYIWSWKFLVPILHLSTTPFKNQNNNLPQTIKPQIKTTSILTNIDNDLPNNQNIREKNYLLQSPNVIIKFRLLFCNWCTIFMVYPMIIMVFWLFSTSI